MEIPADDARDLSNDRLIHIPPVAVTSIDLPLAYNYQPNGLYALEDVPAHDSAGNVVGTEQRLVKKSRLPKGRGDASYFVYHTAESPHPTSRISFSSSECALTLRSCMQIFPRSPLERLFLPSSLGSFRN